MNLLQTWCLLCTTLTFFYPMVGISGTNHFETKLTEIDSEQIELNEVAAEDNE